MIKKQSRKKRIKYVRKHKIKLRIRLQTRKCKGSKRFRRLTNS